MLCLTTDWNLCLITSVSANRDFYKCLEPGSLSPFAMGLCWRVGHIFNPSKVYNSALAFTSCLPGNLRSTTCESFGLSQMFPKSFQDPGLAQNSVHLYGLLDAPEYIRIFQSPNRYLIFQILLLIFSVSLLLFPVVIYIFSKLEH